MSASIFVLVDDKHVPLFRILWIADVPHFCGNDDCTCEGDYEVRLEQDESVWASRQERDNVLKALEDWYNGDHEADPEDPDAGPEWGK
ncbi:MAG: hypothetical protein SFU86_13205 [Pirellulaceae bacterium]|nr:hypothetical protein [Pirellulaceae bacterium]